jgi:hypothetical protein
VALRGLRGISFGELIRGSELSCGGDGGDGVFMLTKCTIALCHFGGHPITSALDNRTLLNKTSMIL